MHIFVVESRDGKWLVGDDHIEFGPYSTRDKAVAACETLNWRFSRPDMSLPFEEKVQHRENPTPYYGAG